MPEPGDNVPARIHVLTASHANTGVIIARRPSKWFHFIKWNMDNDHLEHGAWFHGQFYPLRADLSHNGKYMIYFAANPARRMETWTAVSEPPALTAISLWFQRGTYGGGGVFMNQNTFRGNFHSDYDRQDKWDEKFHRLYKLEIASEFPAHVQSSHAKERLDGSFHERRNRL